MGRRLGIAVAALLGVSGCELTPEETAAILSGLSDGLASAQYGGSSGYAYGYAPAYGFGGVPGRAIQLCAIRGSGRPYRVTGSVRSGADLNRAVGGDVYRSDRLYVTVPDAFGSSLVAVPGWARLGVEPVFGVDQQGVSWRLSSANGCGF